MAKISHLAYLALDMLFWTFQFPTRSTSQVVLEEVSVVHMSAVKGIAERVGCLLKKLVAGIVKHMQFKSIVLPMIFVQLQMNVSAPKS